MSDVFLVRGQAPSNIALIKYMGKSDSASNSPMNPSLSYTLDHLCSFVEIETHQGTYDRWEPLASYPMNLTVKGQDRFLNHFAWLKKTLSIKGYYVLRSGNNFPSDCGLASSASSFAALTRAIYKLADQQKTSGFRPLTEVQLSSLSQRGSGSSCRSFFSPWALWEGDGARPLSLGWSRLLHVVVILDSGKKNISSSEAHRRVLASSLFEGRALRAQKRLEKLVGFLQSQESQNWRQACQVVWEDFWDMHALFETSCPSFGYMTSGSLKVLEYVRDQWQKNDDGPMATMDAGANVHLLFRPDQIHLVDLYKSDLAAWGQFL